jgi:hypothetical protein
MNTNSVDRRARSALFVVLSFAAAPLSAYVSIRIAGNGPLALGLFILFIQPGLIALALGAAFRQRLVFVLQVAFLVGVLGGGVTLIAFLVILDRSGGLS